MKLSRFKFFNSPYWIILLAILGTLLHSWLGQSWMNTSGHAIGSDDAYISYRYAENFFNGYGLVFNIDDRVEGYSNFLYILLITPAFLISKNAVYFYSIALNCFFLAATILFFYQFLKTRFGIKKAILGSLLLALNPWVLANSATGLETTLILAITTASWLLIESYLEHKNTLILISIIAISCFSILSRVDGFILPLSTGIYAVLKGDRRLGIRIFAATIIVLIIYTFWRYFYYQDFISNTYHNKVSGNILSRLKVGFKFSVNFLIETGIWIPLFCVCVEMINAFKDRCLKNVFNFPVFFMSLWLVYLIYIGGDIYFERFFIALIPMGIYIAITTLNKYGKYVGQFFFLIFISSQIYFIAKDGRFEYSNRKYDGWIAAGKFLGNTFPGATVAVDAAGKIPFFSELNTIDMLGLNDRYIGKLHVESGSFYPGHTKFDPDYVLSRKPKIIAAWLKVDSQDLLWGITKDRYADNYSLFYLVNLSRDDKYPKNIVDVSASSQEDIKKLIMEGYGYAILVKK
jgi:arabinofuranosyltransferase